MYHRKTEPGAVPGFCIHPDIQKKLMLMRNRADLKTTPAFEFNDDNASAIFLLLLWMGQTGIELYRFKDEEISRLESPTNACVFCIHQITNSGCEEMNCKANGLSLEQLVIAREMGIPDLCLQGKSLIFRTVC
ncbi:hypothetical protein PanWU01x14_152090 [Parasponia andersonii]|uniref:Uncharacterized protein n=1 Tax=Parasponia andersonii TaxID=3476 RepID=A0A2P5CHT4_PARAD|nr:hypothetical protein PanWU01x14_152090 [Parasponia andersonii]